MIKFIPKHYSLLDAIINGIVLLFDFWNYLLLAERNIFDFVHFFLPCNVGELVYQLCLVVFFACGFDQILIPKIMLSAREVQGWGSQPQLQHRLSVQGQGKNCLLRVLHW